MSFLEGKHAPRGGEVGDFFLRRDTGDLFGPKTRDGWPTESVNIYGPPHIAVKQSLFARYEPFLWAGLSLLLFAHLDIDANTLIYIPIGMALVNLFAK